MNGLKGFTLIELLVTIAIAAILLTVGVPSMVATVQNNRMTTAINDFVSDLNLARSEAIKRGSRVSLCKSADSQRCTDEGDWSQGWLVFADPNDNASYDASNEGETLLRVHQGLAGDDTTLTGNTPLRNAISYLATGFTNLNGTLVLCDGRGFNDYAKAIVIYRTGRPTTVPASESSATSCNASGGAQDDA